MGQIAPCDIDGIHYDQCTIATQELLDAAGNVVDTHPAGVAFFHPEHNHWHQSAVAAFTLKAGNPFTGLTVATGVKITFCFVDVKTYSSTGNEKKTYPAPTSSAMAISRAWRRTGQTSTTSRRRCRSSRSRAFSKGSTT